ncbi:IclR family transcriptional regulator [Desulforhopalus sp. 52FAK]
MTKSTDKPAKQYKVHTLERGLELIELLSEVGKPVSLTEISKLAGFNMSTCHRILDSLKSTGYVRQDSEDNCYSLSFKLVQLAGKISWHKLFKDEIRPVVKNLAERVKLTAYVIVYDNEEALCIERIDGNPHIRIAVLDVGGRMPLHIGAGPKLLLAHLSEAEQEKIIASKPLFAMTKKTITSPELLRKNLKEIRKCGYSISDQDGTDGVSALGWPIRGAEGEILAALTICGVSASFDEEHHQILLDELRKAANEITSQNLSN